jgi:hypothetical protein
MSTSIRDHALTAVRAAANGQPIPTGHNPLRVQAAAAVRQAAGCGLHDAVTAVDWAIEQVNATNIGQHRVPTTHGWLYEFPNGHDASVINDPHQPLRFSLHSKALNVGGDTVAGLTSEQVEAKLHAIAALPAR